MSRHTTRLLSAQDFLIYRTLFGFLSIQLFYGICFFRFPFVSRLLLGLNN